MLQKVKRFCYKDAGYVPTIMLPQIQITKAITHRHRFWYATPQIQITKAITHRHRFWYATLN